MRAVPSCLSRVQLSATPWTAVHQAPLSIGFPRQEYWSGLPFPFPGIFLTQGLNREALYGKVSQIYVCTHTQTHTYTHIHFPGTSDGKESACNVGDPIWIPGLGRSPGKWIGYLLQYPWASLLTQTVKNFRAMREIWVPFLGWEDPPGEGHGNPLQCSCLENPMDRGAWWAMVHEVAESQT